MIADTPSFFTLARLDFAKWRKNRKQRELSFDERKAIALKGVTPNQEVNPFIGELPEPPSNVIPFSNHPVVVALREAGGSVESNRQLARLQKISDGESSKRVREVKHLLLIGRDGKNKTISLRA